MDEGRFPLYGLRTKPDAARVMKIGNAWRPYRTVACWYLWRSYEDKGP